jgi:hypothetical protein
MVSFGETDLGQPDGDGTLCIFNRLAGRVAAERRVHVIIGGQRHAASLKFQVSSFKR